MSIVTPNSLKPFTVPDFLAAKKAGRRITVLTCYDYTMAKLLDAGGVDALLVGDSLGMIMQGQPNSLAVTLDDVLYHTRITVRGVQRALVIADMPFMSYQLSPQQALENAGRLVKEGGAHAVKLEGGQRSVAAIESIASADIPVMGHVGMTPQSVHRLGGFRVQRDGAKILDDALAVEEAGAFALVVECVPTALAQQITDRVKIPTIGIGAGVGCDGQILVTHDMLGMFGDFKPHFVKHYANLGEQIREAVAQYCQEVRDGKYPDSAHSYR